MSTSTMLNQDSTPGLFASDILAQKVQSQVNRPAVLFPEQLIRETMRERQEGIPLIHVAPWHDFQLPYALDFFFGATYHGNPNEVEHLHPAQGELYFCIEGNIRVACSRGNEESTEYTVHPGDVLLVPPGTWHLVKWDSPGWAYVVKGPNHLIGDAAKITR